MADLRVCGKLKLKRLATRVTAVGAQRGTQREGHSESELGDEEGKNAE